MTFFKFLWAFDALAAIIILYFFFVGLADGTVSARNAGIWMALVLGIITVMGGSAWFKLHNFPVPAYLLLSVLALPAVGFLGYMLIILLNGKSAWR